MAASSQEDSGGERERERKRECCWHHPFMFFHVPQYVAVHARNETVHTLYNDDGAMMLQRNPIEINVTSLFAEVATI